MKPALHHRICARPLAICWALGIAVLWSVTTYGLVHSAYFSPENFGATAALSLLLGYAALAGLGFFLGNIPWLALMIGICRWVNGGRLAVGDCVIVLVGPRAGTATAVYEMTRGQGGQPLARVELGAEAREKYLDLFEEYELLLTSRHPAPMSVPS